jgi:acetyltransferase-like isoleucine patch superfamily enzyme
MLPARSAWGAFGDSTIAVPARVLNPEFVHIGDRVEILEMAFLSTIPIPGTDVRPRVVIEDDVRIGRGATLSVAAELIIEPGVTIGDFVLLTDTFHPFEVEDRLGTIVPGEPVRIGAGAVLGSHVIVLPGVHIGARSVVWHHAVVGRDVAPGERYVGHPAWRSRGRRPPTEVTA